MMEYWSISWTNKSRNEADNSHLSIVSDPLSSGEDLKNTLQKQKKILLSLAVPGIVGAPHDLTVS